MYHTSFIITYIICIGFVLQCICFHCLYTNYSSSKFNIIHVFQDNNFKADLFKKLKKRNLLCFNIISLYLIVYEFKVMFLWFELIGHKGYWMLPGKFRVGFEKLKQSFQARLKHLEITTSSCLVNDVVILGLPDNIWILVNKLLPETWVKSW